MQRRPVCAIEDLPPGTMKLVQAGKFGVGVYNIDGVAVRDRELLLARGRAAVRGLCGRHQRIRAGRSRVSCVTCAKARSRDARGISGSSTSRPGSTSRIRRSASAPTRSTSPTGRCISPHEPRHRRERSAAFPLQRRDPALPVARAQAAGDPRRRAAVVPGARRRLPPGPLRRRLSGIGPGHRCAGICSTRAVPTTRSSIR